MGFFSRLFIPRGVRRAVHPGSAVKRALTPKRVVGGEPQADNLIMQRYCPVCHKLIDMKRFSEATRPSDVAGPWHFERHTREDYSGGTATQRVCPGSGKNEHDARDTW